MMIKKNIKKIFNNKFAINFFAKINDWQCSSSLILKCLSSLIAWPMYYFLKERYYRALKYTRDLQHVKVSPMHSQTGPACLSETSKFIPDKMLLRLINRDLSVNKVEYSQYLQSIHFNDSFQLQWSKYLIVLGRLDLAKSGFIDLINRPNSFVKPHIKLEAYRYSYITSFLLGDNLDSTKYARLTVLYRNTLYKPNTPRTYRILGEGWFAAFGHVCSIDFYMKYLKLYKKDNIRVIARCDASNLPPGEAAQYILNKFAEQGVQILQAHEVEKDYNQWAAENSFQTWDKLTESEKAALVDDCWEYDFNDGDFSTFTHGPARIQKEWEDQGNKPLLTLSENENKWLDNYLLTLGLPKGVWYVCLHVREAGFHGSWNAVFPSMRDASISDYHLAIEEIVKAGGWVIRTGDATMSPLPTLPNVIDYANSPFRTPVADALIPARCRFMLGTNSGYLTICSIYNIPCVLTNWVPIGWPLWLRQDLMLPKLFHNKKTGKMLNLVEIFEYNLAFLQNTSEVPEGIELVSNMPEDIAEGVLEMLAQCNKESSLPFSTKLQEQIQLQYETIAKCYGGFTGARLANSFIKKHQNIFLEEVLTDSKYVAML